MRVILLLCLFLAVAYAQTSSGCCNPMVKYRHDWWSNLCHNLSEPIYNSSSQGICSYITQNNGSSCCTTADYFKITLVWATARAIIQDTVTIWRDELAVYELEQAVWKSILNNITANSTLPGSTKTAIENLFNQVFSAIDNFLASAITNWASCARAILRYWAGLVCLSCDPNWSQFITYDSTTGVATLNLNSNTCNDVRGDCEPFWTLLDTLVNQIATAAADFVLQVPNSAPPFSGGSDICNGDCGAWICDTFFAGPDYNQANIPSNSTKRSVDLRPTSGVLTAHFPEETKRMYQMYNRILNTALSMKSLTGAIRQSTSTTTTNTYTSNGYDAYAQGENSGLDASVASASGLSSWLSYLL